MMGAEEARIPTVREWRNRRDQAGELLYIVAGISRGPLRRKAWEIFCQWQEEEITFQEAEKEARGARREGQGVGVGPAGIFHI